MQFISGRANCHLPGLYSLVLSERTSAKRGMKRIFYASRRMPLWHWDTGGFVLKPHNHRQSIGLQRLHGKVMNWKFRQAAEGMSLVAYAFSSALLGGEFGLELVPQLERAYEYDVQALTAEPLLLHWSDIHTITAEEGAVWLVEEFERAPEGSARCFSASREPLKLDSASLYVPLSAEELQRLSETVSAKVETLV